MLLLKVSEILSHMLMNMLINIQSHTQQERESAKKSEEVLALSLFTLLSTPTLLFPSPEFHFSEAPMLSKKQSLLSAKIASSYCGHVTV